MHIRILRARPDVQFICHAHPATTIGIISGGADLLPFTPDFVAIVDRVAYVPYVVPCGRELAIAVEQAAQRGFNVVALRNHGVVTLGRSAAEALTRMVVVEDQAKTQLAAMIAGKPRALTGEEQEGIRNLDAESYRRKLLADQR
jgi:ribulose-5-phosphate 4-epimerase/fuculose-1-phosphate aldolase